MRAELLDHALPAGRVFAYFEHAGALDLQGQDMESPMPAGRV